MRMECPMCGLELPIAILEYHAWECNGREEPDEGSLTRENAVPSTQVAYTPDVQQADEEEPASPSETSEVPHPNTETDEIRECPLCFCSFPADLIIEHSAFCNGPSCGKLPEQAVLEFTERVSCDPTEPQEQEIGACAQPPEEVIPSHSQALGSSVFTEVSRNIIQVFHSYVGRNDAVGSREVTRSVEPKSGQEDSETSQNVNKVLQYLAKVQKHLDNDPEFNQKGAVVSRETIWSVEPKSGQEDNETSEDKEKLLQYLGEMQKRLDNDPELKQLLCPLLKVSRPLEILQCLIKSIFGKATGSNVTPFALFFYLARMFLPRILEVESWTALLKWLDLIIPDVVVPWITRMGGWVKVRPPTMSHFASPLGLLLILALSTTSPLEARPDKQSHQDDHMQGLVPNPRLGQGHQRPRWHAIPYIQINDDGQVSKSEHQNEYTLMDIQFTSTGIVIKGRKSARYLCSHTNSTLYSTPQLEENCTFKEGAASNRLGNDGNLEQRGCSQARTGTACVQSERVNPNSPDPVEMIV
ncbi:uncharacterized protein LOC132383002 isoform X3 [Hypanus sabinus]|uniref:uncharacterized protein LOC132383002 isoform X3 n=1 Tax=Hypanus sabinus TaxID=79690 RepID=UPI0028C37ED0|nr:uncharacterized protein LOC132383002 isoform X3 [Hypanus sabinus]